MLKDCTVVFENLLKSIAQSSLKAVTRKFRTKKYFEVARFGDQNA
jgi:hypothetical protein